MFTSTSSLTIDHISLPELQSADLDLYVVRADLIHPQVSGNKWYKLKYNLLKAREMGAKRVMSFGGAYSNHIHALAYAAHILGLESVAVIRGEPVVNPTLADARQWGMQLSFCSRADYRKRHDDQWVEQKKQELQADWVIPEGGSNGLAVQGVAELAAEILQQLPELNYLLSAVGTGGTLAGLVKGMSLVKGSDHVIIEGLPVLKNASFLRQDIQQLLDDVELETDVELEGWNLNGIKPDRSQSDTVSWSLDAESHYGGYAKVNAEHQAQWLALEKRLGMPLDPVYTSKVFRRFFERVKLGCYPRGSSVAVLHSGGTQGRRGLIP